MNWFKNWLCGGELAVLKAEIKRLKNDLSRARYERDKALNRADHAEQQCRRLCYELNTRAREEHNSAMTRRHK